MEKILERNSVIGGNKNLKLLSIQEKVLYLIITLILIIINLMNGLKKYKKYNILLKLL
jgi:cell division protein FtsL